MRKNNRLTDKLNFAIFMFTGRKAQDIPGWVFIVGLVLGLIVIIVLLWLAAKSGKTIGEQLTEIS